MAIIKLACQGCGANLDAKDDQRIIQCGYCGTNNQLRQTVQPRPEPAPPRMPTPVEPMPSVPPSVPEIQYIAAPTNMVQAPARSGVGRGFFIFILITGLLPLVIGGFVAWTVLDTTSSILDDAKSAISSVNQNYLWVSARPFVIDVNGDVEDDIVGLVQPLGDEQVQLRAIDGVGFRELWSVELGRRSEFPELALRYEPGSQLLLVERGAALHAYELQTGTQRWFVNLPDRVAAIVLDDPEQLWVATIDDQTQHVALADGKRTPTSKQPGETATPLRDDGEYELIPQLGELDLKRDQFAELDVDQAFCPLEYLPLHVGRRIRDEHKHCTNPSGLAWAHRSKGTPVPFWVGYAQADKGERWRVQMTEGSLEPIETGFSQPRAELFADEAIVTFTPSSDQRPRVRRISLPTGEMRWETILEPGQAAWINGMVVGTDKLAIQRGQSLVVLMMADGSQRAELGGF